MDNLTHGSQKLIKMITHSLVYEYLMLATLLRCLQRYLLIINGHETKERLERQQGRKEGDEKMTKARFDPWTIIYQTT